MKEQKQNIVQQEVTPGPNSRRNIGLAVMSGSLATATLVFLSARSAEASDFIKGNWNHTPGPTNTPEKQKTPRPTRTAPPDKTSTAPASPTEGSNNTPTKAPDTATPGHDKVTATPTRKIPHYPTYPPTSSPTGTDVIPPATGTEVKTPTDTATPTATNKPGSPPQQAQPSFTATTGNQPGSEVTVIPIAPESTKIIPTPVIPAHMPETGEPNLIQTIPPLEELAIGITLIGAGIIVREIRANRSISKRNLFKTFRKN